MKKYLQIRLDVEVEFGMFQTIGIFQTLQVA
jgi:hypothetical protein